ncbi:hypothetical protein CBR_g21938 [Chara braunii]|uniref:DUF4460 domain-containing protein n=1 Tax=Chara braunii TaxID=69332 RepID=A0A388L1L9_CHABU|nr:hypothetical protein CBR_g21938 [Chara braunii]|eukprot:GBG76189.1 hypothetical protein CBR_g21938 [Chara braunii]
MRRLSVPAVVLFWEACSFCRNCSVLRSCGLVKNSGVLHQQRREWNSGLLRASTRSQSTEDNSASASTLASTVTLKSQLRVLYKLVHPDLFQDRPTERAANEKSFKLLQEYLSQAQSGSRTLASEFKFEFYLRPPPASEDAEEEHNSLGEKPEESDLQRVLVSLPGPEPCFSGEISTATRRSLRRLLIACGVPPFADPELEWIEKFGALSATVRDWDNDNGSASPFGTRAWSGSRARSSSTVKDGQVGLTEFFLQASEIQRQNDVVTITSERHCILVRNALRMGRGVVASFRYPLSEQSFAAKADALQKLGRALDKAPSLDLVGCAFVLGDCYGIDPVGNIWVNAGDEEDEWAKWLSHIDVNRSRTNKMAHLARKGKERDLAEAMQVEMVFADNATGASPGYEDFLARMSASAGVVGAVGGGRFVDLPVRVVRSSAGLLQNSGNWRPVGEEGFGVDLSMGLVTVPISVELPTIYEFIEQSGGEAMLHRKRYKQSEQSLRELVLHVRQKLRLRHLSSDECVTQEEFLHCCNRLLRHAAVLRPLLEGLCLHVSDKYKLPKEGDVPLVHLKWSFSLSDL